MLQIISISNQNFPPHFKYVVESQVVKCSVEIRIHTYVKSWFNSSWLQNCFMKISLPDEHLSSLALKVSSVGAFMISSGKEFQ